MTNVNEVNQAITNESGVSDAIRAVTNNLNRLTSAVAGNDRCGSLSSTYASRDVSEANSATAVATKELTDAYISVTDTNGQLYGSLLPVANAIVNLSNNVSTLSSLIKALETDIDILAFTRSPDVASTLDQLSNSLTELSKAVGSVSGPGDVLSELHDALHLIQADLQELSPFISDFEITVSNAVVKCNIESDLPNALEYLQSAVDMLVSVLPA